MILCSLAVKSGISALLIAKDGKEVTKVTRRLPADDNMSAYKSIVVTLISAVKQLRAVIEDGGTDNIIFECGNSIVVSWFKKGVATADCSDEFAEVLRLLDEIPCRYLFKVNKKPYASAYLSEKYIEKPVISNSIDFINGVEE